MIPECSVLVLRALSGQSEDTKERRNSSLSRKVSPKFHCLVIVIKKKQEEKERELD